MSKLKIPASWALCSLKDAGVWGSGGTPSRGTKAFFGGNIAWVKTGDLNDGLVEICDEYITEAGVDDISGGVYPRLTVIMAMYGATIGKLGLLGIDAATNQACACCICYRGIEPWYLFYWLKNYRKEFLALGRGGGQPNISRELIYKQPFGLPPTDEQKRIVAKIESAQGKVKTIESSISKAEELIEKYRESLLQKAFRGELVPQDPNDEPASRLIERIRAEKAKQSDGKKKKKDELPPIKPEEIPFEVPKSWEWVRALNLCLEVESGATPDANQMRESGAVQFLKVYNLSFDGSLFDQVKPSFISSALHNGDLARSRSVQGDVLVNIVGPPLGKVTLLTDSNREYNHNQAIVHFRPDGRLLEPAYLSLCLQSPRIKASLIAKAKQTSGQANLNVSTCRSLVIPCPPLEEQKRIVARLEVLSRSIDEQVVRLRNIEIGVKALGTSILDAAFGGRLVEQIETEGTGNELLEKIRSEQSTKTETKTEKKTSAPAKKKRAKK